MQVQSRLFGAGAADKHLESQSLSKSSGRKILVRWRLFFSDDREKARDKLAIQHVLLLFEILQTASWPARTSPQRILSLPDLLLSAFLCRMPWGQRGQAQMLLTPGHSPFQHSQS